MKKIKSNEFNNKVEKLSLPLNGKEKAIHHIGKFGEIMQINEYVPFIVFFFNEIYLIFMQTGTKHTAQSLLFVQLFSAVNNKRKIKMNWNIKYDFLCHKL